MDTYLPPKYSLNSFFVRHVAHPRRMRTIHGLNNSRICAVNDVGFIKFPGGAVASSSVELSQFPPNQFNEDLLRSDGSLNRRREKALPYNGQWQTYGLVDDVSKWRSELNSLASSVGLVTQGDIDEFKRKKERDQVARSMQRAVAPSSPTRKGNATASKLVAPGTSGVSTRLNEPLRTGQRTGQRASRMSRASRGLPLTGQKYIVEQADREAWMLQVLCQILQTDNLSDVQSWLVSTSDQEKERVKQLIDQAMKGLEESGRIEVAHQGAHTSKAATATVNERAETTTSKALEQQQHMTSISEIENSLKRINLNRPGIVTPVSVSAIKERSSESNNSSKLPNILKIEDDPTEWSTAKKNSSSSSVGGSKLKPIPELLKVESRGGVRTPPVSTVFNINMQQSGAAATSIESAVVKLETPRNSPKDYKVEQVKVTMLVKDEKSNSLQEINGDWVPASKST